MASLSDARFSLPEPQAAVSRVTAGVDLSVASAIKAFGQIGGEAYRGTVQGELINDLQETGDIINTINQGDEAIREAVRKKQIDPTSKRFQSLAAATEQGTISQQRAAIEAEVLLRESIARAPGFADQFRATARETLGFDPTGQNLNQLFLSGPDASKTAPLTQEQKDMQQAEAMYRGGAVQSVEEGFQLIQRDRADQLRENIQSARIQQGRLQAGKVAVEGANRATRSMNGIMLGAFQQIEAEGGVMDTESFKGAIMSARDMVKSKIENEMAASQDYVYTSEEYNQVRARIDEQAESYLQLLDNQDMTAILSRNKSRLADLVEIAGTSLAPDLALLAPMGEHAVRSYMDMMVLSGGDPRKMQELMKADPSKAYVGNIILSAGSIAPSLRAIANESLGSAVSTGQVDKTTAQAMAKDQANAIATNRPTGDGIDIGKVVQSLSEVDLPVTAVSLISQTPYQSFNEMSDPQRRGAVSLMQRQQNQQLQTMIRGMQEGGFQLAWDGSQFIVNDPQNRPINQLDFTAPVTFASDERRAAYTQQRLPSVLGIGDALEYLNNNMVPIMQDIRWSNQAGFENGGEWAADVISRVNLQTLQSQMADADSPLVASMSLRDQAQLNQALRGGDLEQVMTLLAGTEGSGLGGPTPTGFQTEPNLTGVTQPIIRDQAGTDPGGVPLSLDVQGDPNTLGFEGFRPTIYEDPAGIKTIGYGRNLEANPMTDDDLRAIGEEPGTAPEDLNLTEEQALLLYRRDANKVIPGLSSSISNFRELSRPAQKALIDMAFNMGVGGVRGFTKMIEAIEAGDMQEAANQMLDSAWGRGWIRDPKTGDWIKDEDGNNKVFGGLVDRAQFNANRLLQQ